MNEQRQNVKAKNLTSNLIENNRDSLVLLIVN